MNENSDEKTIRAGRAYVPMIREQTRRRLASMHLEIAATALSVAATEVKNAAGAMTQATARQFDFTIVKLEKAIAKARLDLEAPLDD